MHKTGKKAQTTGDIGELDAKRLLLSGNLEVSTLVPDRTAKDMLVEWPLDDLIGCNLDTRPAARSCLVQVKSSTRHNPHFSLKLSSAERLAKDLRPVFLIIVSLSNSRVPKSMHLLHLRGDLLARVLKSLRERAAGSSRRSISFNVKDGVLLPTEGAAARELLESEIGPDMAKYAAEKEQQLASLGYSDRRIIMNVTLAPISRQDFIEALLSGRELKARHVNVRERRFEIEVPGVPSLPKLPATANDVVVRVLSKPKDAAMELAHPSLTEPARVACKLLRADLPNFTADDYRLRISCPLFRIDFNEMGAAIATENEEWAKAWPLNTWSNSATILSLLSDAESRITVMETEDGKRHEFSMTGATTAKRESDISRLATHLQRISKIAKSANTKMPVGTIDEFWEIPEYLLDFAAGERRYVSQICFKSNKSDSTLASDERPAVLVVGALSLGDRMIAVARRAQFTVAERAETIDWRSGQLEFLHAEALDEPAGQSYEYFKERMARIANLSGLLDLRDLRSSLAAAA